jgi:hypothetical protein
LRISNLNFVRICLKSHACYTSRLSHYPWFNYPNYKNKSQWFWSWHYDSILWRVTCLRSALGLERMLCIENYVVSNLYWESITKLNWRAIELLRNSITARRWNPRRVGQTYLHQLHKLKLLHVMFFCNPVEIVSNILYFLSEERIQTVCPKHLVAVMYHSRQISCNTMYKSLV